MRIIVYILFLCAVPVVNFGQSIQSYFETPNDSSSCALLYHEADKYSFMTGQEKRALDSFKIYVEHCFDQVQAVNSFSSISTMAGAVYSDRTDIRWLELREWLKSVLYLSSSSEYYCADVLSIINTFQSYNDTLNGVRNNNGLVSICRFLLEEKKCENFSSFWTELIEKTRKDQLSFWRDTVTDSLKTPIDTSSPSLEELDLTILRGPNQGAVSPVANERRLVELIATLNPFIDILELKYRLDKSDMVRIDVYDLLGRAIYSEGQGYKAEGQHVLSLQSKAWSSGSYYVRLSSPSGEVKTVKVVKE